jgi:hypothetical protein
VPITGVIGTPETVRGRAATKAIQKTAVRDDRSTDTVVGLVFLASRESNLSVSTCGVGVSNLHLLLISDTITIDDPLEKERRTKVRQGRAAENVSARLANQHASTTESFSVDRPTL